MHGWKHKPSNRGFNRKTLAPVAFFAVLSVLGPPRSNN